MGTDHVRLTCRVPCKACGTLQPSADYYTPGRVMLLLWRYFDLVRLVGSSASPDTETQRLPRETPEGGHESGAVIKADLDSALMQLGKIERKVAWDFYVLGKYEYEIADEVKSSRPYVHRTRLNVLRKMALSLGWVPKKTAEEDDDSDLSRSAMRARMQMVLEQAFGTLEAEQQAA